MFSTCLPTLYIVVVVSLSVLMLLPPPHLSVTLRDLATSDRQYAKLKRNVLK